MLGLLVTHTPTHSAQNNSSYHHHLNTMHYELSIYVPDNMLSIFIL